MAILSVFFPIFDHCEEIEESRSKEKECEEEEEEEEEEKRM